MDGNRNYSIVFKNETSEPKKNPVAGNATEPTEESSPSAGKSLVKGLVAFKSFVQPFVEQVATAYTSTVALRTGAEELQEKMQFAQSVISKGVGIVESIAVGAAVGNLPGAVLGTLIGIINTGVSYAIKAQEIKWQSQVEDASLGAMLVRAGGAAAFSGSRERSQ